MYLELYIDDYMGGLLRYIILNWSALIIIGVFKKRFIVEPG